MSRKLSDDEVQEIVAYELGVLDAKHGFGYSPPRSCTESFYREGFKSRHFQHPGPNPPVTYRNKLNWGQ